MGIQPTNQPIMTIPTLTNIIPQVVGGFLSAPQYQTCSFVAQATPAGFEPMKNYCLTDIGSDCEENDIYTMEDCIAAIANEIPSIARGDGIIFSTRTERCFVATIDRDVPWDCNSGRRNENEISGTCLFAPVTRSSYSYIDNPDCYDIIPDGIVKLPFSPTKNLKQYIVEAPFNAFEVLATGTNVAKDIKLPVTFYTYAAAQVDEEQGICAGSACDTLGVSSLEDCIDAYITRYESGNWSGYSPMNGVAVVWDTEGKECGLGAVEFQLASNSCVTDTSTFAVIGMELPASLATDCPVPEIVLRDIVDLDVAVENATALNKLLSPPVGFSFGGNPIIKGLFDFASYVRPSPMA